MIRDRDTVNAEEHIKAGNLDRALEVLQSAIQKDPGQLEPRLHLFQLLSIMGEWHKALAQLNEVAEMNPDALALVLIYRELLLCEVFRAEVFTGNCEPLQFGEPNNWVATLIRSMEHTENGNGAQASELVMEAMDHAAPRSGTINNESFSWISDADMRLGPVFEIMLDGKYYWVPIENIAEITFSEPENLRDLVWLPVQVQWVYSGSSEAFMPTRYPGPATLSDAQRALARRKTDWTDIGEGFYTGSGQRMFTTENDEYSLLQTRKIAFDTDIYPG